MPWKQGEEEGPCPFLLQHELMQPLNGKGCNDFAYVIYLLLM